MRRTSSRLVAIGSLAFALAGCDEASDEERCTSVEERLSAELIALPTACRTDDDCVGVQTHCGTFMAASGDPPEAITTLSKLTFEEKGCCGDDWDGRIPVSLPDVECRQDPDDEGRHRCVATSAPTCAAACNLLAVCPDRDPDGWFEAEGGCQAGCEARLAEHPARTIRLTRCAAELGCGGEGRCGGD